MNGRSISKYLFALSLLFLATGFSFRCQRTAVEDLPTVTLEYWRVFDNESSMREIIDSFQAQHPNIRIVYKKFRFDEYEQQLLNAFAEDRAPDLFSIPNTWIRRNSARILPAPSSITLPVMRVKGTLKKEAVVEFERSSGISARGVAESFVQQVGDDVVLDGQVMGLPLALDTMALFYNKDLLAQAGIPQPPKTWKEVQEITPKLTKIGSRGEILQSAIALGGGANIPRSFDILSLLMMQNGAQMAANDGSPLFDKTPATATGSANPSPDALRFYADFATPTKVTYTWNETLPNAFDLFTQGRLAMFLGYSYHLDALERATTLQWDVAPVPQVDSNYRVEYANYWVEAVSKKTRSPNEAWGFLQFAASAQAAQSYMAQTQKPPALRSLVEAARAAEHPAPVFGDAALTARSWYKGENPLSAEEAFNSMASAVVKGEMDPSDATERAANQIAASLKVERP